ncbi:(R)-mandelonitrile beta-glucosyltransferase-like [Cryptomeria japonica]|uniref:(R)-mandelonitrile beta-glucosyltransferase-like n=1 Tax=Cryptomeria japonica TaxID=3369 RepID=UPI0025AD7F98|nr:(R)-mandelonitrile beta-glucosyltransferase-like [Cryptomeria japonica]
MGMSGLHAVIVPFPAQGTINPLINLAQLLSSRGVFITFVNMEWSHKCMSKAAHNDDEPTFKFLTNPDGLPPDHGRLANLAEYVIAVEHLGPVLEQHLLSSLSDGKTPPITCIITENFMSCTHQVAKKLGVPRVIFWTLCAASSIAQCNAKLLLSRGHIPVKVEESKRADKVITCLPGNLPPLFLSDLFSFYRATDTSGVLFQWALRESQFQSKLDYVLVNTFDELEPPEMVSALSCNGCPALAVGPVFLPNLLAGKDLNGRGSLQE